MKHYLMLSLWVVAGALAGVAVRGYLDRKATA